MPWPSLGSRMSNKFHFKVLAMFQAKEITVSLAISLTFKGQINFVKGRQYLCPASWITVPEMREFTQIILAVYKMCTYVLVCSNWSSLINLLINNIHLYKHKCKCTKKCAQKIQNTRKKNFFELKHIDNYILQKNLKLKLKVH